MGRDASIIIEQVKFTYNGTYMCQVKNPPDVHGAVGETRLRVVTTGLQWVLKQNLFSEPNLPFCVPPKVKFYLGQLLWDCTSV